jgi:hypothetical protein
MEPLNPLPPIQPFIPPVVRSQRGPRVERDEQREPAPDDQHPPQQQEEEFEDSYDEEWQDLRALPTPPASAELPPSDPDAIEKDSPSIPANLDRRGTYDPPAGSDDEHPGPHIDITA